MRKVWPAFIGVGAAFFAGCVTIALAQAEDSNNKELFGHRVRIVEKDNVKRLMIDGETVVKNQHVFVDDMHTIAGVDVLIGTSGSGGNICDDDVFVVSFPKNAVPRLDGPTGECLEITYKVEDKAIRFTSGPRSDKPRTWTWTPAKGMSAKVAAVAPNPFQNSDLWEDLRAGRLTHPSELFGHPGMKDAIASLIGDDRKTVYDIADGTGSLKREGELFVGTGAPPRQWGEREVMFVFDPTTKGIYVSWKPGVNKPLIVRPEAEQWSPLARARLDEWLKKWEEIAAIEASPASEEPAPVDTSADDLLNDLRNKRLSKPEDIFKHPGMFRPTETLLTGYRETVLSMVRGGQGTVEDKGNVLVGTSCLPDECSDKSLMFALDPTSKKVFFAWKTAGTPIVVKPPVKEWPQPAKAELMAWSKRWIEAAQNGGKKPQ